MIKASKLRKILQEYLEYADSKGIRRLYEVMPTWVKENYPKAYSETPELVALESVLHKNEVAYRALDKVSKAEVAELRRRLYSKIVLRAIGRHKVCSYCGNSIDLKKLHNEGGCPISMHVVNKQSFYCNVSCSSKSDNKTSAMKATNLERYGVTCTLASKASIKKKKATWKANWGVDNPSKAAEVVDRIQSSRYGRKWTTIAGKKFQYQGYENVLLKHLIKNIGVPTSAIENRPGQIGMFEYDMSGNVHNYLPDMSAVVKGKLWYFEVKSTATLGTTPAQRRRVLAKAKAMWNLHEVNYSLVVCSKTSILHKANNYAQLKEIMGLYR